MVVYTPAQIITAPAQLIIAPAQLITAPAQLITAPAQLITAPAQSPATEVVVNTALLFFLLDAFSHLYKRVCLSVFLNQSR